MRKFIIVLSLFILNGCSISENLQTNLFGDLWDKFVIENKTSPLINRTQRDLTKRNEESFVELDEKLDKIRGFLILGEYIEEEGSDELVFREGLMRIADQNNEDLVNDFKETLDMIDGNSDTKSLFKELQTLKDNVKKTCKKQSSGVKCDI